MYQDFHVVCQLTINANILLQYSKYQNSEDDTFYLISISIYAD